jgi:hypothetical protein
MKYRIPLTNHNIQILIDKFGAEQEKLNREYWIKHIMADQEQVLAILNNRFGPKDPQRRIYNRAGKLRRKYIREITGIPKMNGTIQRKREYEKFFKRHKIQLGVDQ